MPEKVSPGVLEERINNLVRSAEAETKRIDQKIYELDRKYERINENVEEDLEKMADNFSDLKIEMINEMSDIRIAQEQGERRVMTDIEKSRISRNRWIIGTAFASVIGVLGLILDILKG